jgi:hypothetical protein
MVKVWNLSHDYFCYAALYLASFKPNSAGTHLQSCVSKAESGNNFYSSALKCPLNFMFCSF